MTSRRSARSDNHQERIAILETKVDSMNSSMAQITKQLTAIEAAVNRNKGFWGAVVLIGSALWAAISHLGPAIASMFSSPKA